MAEGTLFSLASTLISTVTSPPCEDFSPWGAADELQKTVTSIKTIQAVLIDAEKRSQHSAPGREWIRRVRDALFIADDLFDEVATIHLLYQQNMKEGRSESRSSIGCSFSIHDRLKAVRMDLDQICEDLGSFEFVRQNEEPVTDIRKGVGSGWCTDLDLVVGRDDDMKLIQEFLSDETTEGVSIMAIVGIEGMGKTTLAKLVYNSEEVSKRYNSRWWVCISSMFDGAVILERIFKAIGWSSQGLKEKFLLVIDDAEELKDYSMWDDLRKLHSSDDITGSKIIATTKSPSVAMAVDASRTLNLNVLSSDASWDLFEGLAFTREQENDPSWKNLGRKILKKCGNVPMAIKSVASLLYTKSSKQEWKSILNLLPVESGGSILPILNLSYDSLPANLKLCISYCSVFPRYFNIQKDDLMHLWAAQGYVIPKNFETYEEVGDASFNKLVRRFFFQEKTRHLIKHGLIHDLAVNVAKGETIALTEGLYDITDQQVRHCTVDYVTTNYRVIPRWLLACVRLRSLLFMRGGLLMPPAVAQLLTSFKFLRALDLRHQSIEEVPSSIGGLLHLRYLNLSGGHFYNLPESITELLNLLVLDISWCRQLQVLPLSFVKLINLRHLNNEGCFLFRYMPPRFGELTSLQHLSYFKVGKVTADVESSRLDALRGLKLRGTLHIAFDVPFDNWDEDEWWELPTTVQTLDIWSYPGMRIPHWDQRRVDLPSLLPRLVQVKIFNSSTIIYLPPFRHLPYLKALSLSYLRKLTYVEDDQEKHASEQCDQSAAGYSMLFFPCLEELELMVLPKLISWSREVEAVTTSKVLAAEEHSSRRDLSDQMPSFPILSTLKIERCSKLISVPPCPSLRKLELKMFKKQLIQHVLSTCSHSLETAALNSCTSLNRFSGENLTSLRRLELKVCPWVNELHLPQHNVLEELMIQSCPRLKLWEEGGVDWDSLINLRLLSLDVIPDAERLPVCLSQRTALRILKIDSHISSDSSVQGTKAQGDTRRLGVNYFSNTI